MSPKRGDRAAPPARPDGCTLRFATSEAAKGWDDLCRQAPGNTRAAFETIEATPCPTPATSRHHQLKGQLATGTHAGKSMPNGSTK